MPRNTKLLHPDFINYMYSIINHPNYSGLPIKNKNNGEYIWLAPADTEIGKDRIKWCINKAYELKLIGDISQSYPGLFFNKGKQNCTTSQRAKKFTPNCFLTSSIGVSSTLPNTP